MYRYNLVLQHKKTGMEIRNFYVWAIDEKAAIIIVKMIMKKNVWMIVEASRDNTGEAV